MPGSRPLRRPAPPRFFRAGLIFLAVLGPGVITANVDNDATGIAGYAIAGSTYGLGLLWVLPLSMVALAIIQDMAARLGLATGKGLADLIRERFGPRITVVTMLALLVANAATTVAEFAGIAAAAELFHIPRVVAVPIAAVAVWTLVLKGTYQLVERVLLVGSLAFLTYIVAGLLARPDWGEVGRAMVVPSFEFDVGFITVLIGLIGTTITPWMQFYLQASIVDKGRTADDATLTRIDVYFGSVVMTVVAMFIIVATAATLYANGQSIESASDAAQALEPLAGRFAGALFGIGLLNASFMAASVLPLSTSYAMCEAFGFERGVDRTFREAPVFLGLYTALIAGGAAVVLIPHMPLIKILFLPNIVGGILLPLVLIIMLKLANSREIMGDLANGPFGNAIGWAVSLAVIVLTVVYVAATIFTA